MPPRRVVCSALRHGMASPCLPRRGAGVVERGGLENRCALCVPRVRIPVSPPSQTCDQQVPASPRQAIAQQTLRAAGGLVVFRSRQAHCVRWLRGGGRKPGPRSRPLSECSDKLLHSPPSQTCDQQVPALPRQAIAQQTLRAAGGLVVFRSRQIHCVHWLREGGLAGRPAHGRAPGSKCERSPGLAATHLVCSLCLMSVWML